MTMIDPNLPRLALSIRQPWAWAILQAGKPVENRDWQPGNRGLQFRGPVCIHASGGMTTGEYREARQFIWSLGILNVPMADELQRGGIVGVVTIADVVRRHDSEWFFGPIGLVLKDPQPIEFIPAKGALGFFDWRSRVIADHLDDSPAQAGLFDGCMPTVDKRAVNSED